MEKVMIFGKIADDPAVAIFEDGNLVEFHMERLEESLTGNIFVGKIENIVPNLHAFFVNIGRGKNGFLRSKDSTDFFGSLQLGSKVLVQVKKDPIGNKGAQLTMKIGIPGRYLVYFPFSMRRIAISRRIEDQMERKRLRKVLKGKLKKNEGVIIRTASEGMEEERITDELERLRKIWEKIYSSYRKARKPKILYVEPDILEYMIRERFDSNVSKIVVENVEEMERIKKIIKNFEDDDGKVEFELVDSDPFERYDVLGKLERSLKRVQELDCGGSVVIDSTEAMTVIDVNSGGNVEGENFEDLALRTNLEAAKEIVRQIRLRNVGGIVIIDFIDMKMEESKKKLISCLFEELKKDKGRTSIVGFTKLGLLEMTRKRTSIPLVNAVFSKCPVCGGKGFIPSKIYTISKLKKDLFKLKDEGVEEVLVKLHESFEHFMTRKRKKELKEGLGKLKLRFTFDHPDPTGYGLEVKR